MEDVEFPVVVDSQPHELKESRDDGSVQVTTAELVRVGADKESFGDLDDKWTFLYSEYGEV